MFVFYFLTRGFPHFDGGEYFVWPMYGCSVLSIGKEGSFRVCLKRRIIIEANKKYKISNSKVKVLKYINILYNSIVVIDNY